MINFASDNYAGVHPDILKAISAANDGAAPAYGADNVTEKAIQVFKKIFNDEIAVFFVFNGTGANVTALSALTHSYHAIICAESAHIQVDECGAPEKLTGAKLLCVPTDNGKLTIEKITRYFARIGDQHHVQPKVISISQTTEYGTVYSLAEIRELAEFAHKNQLYLHVDGARISNAAISLNVNFKEMIQATGVDVLSFGGTKNGMMFGEAVIFFNSMLAKDFPYIRKQSMQLASKMRFISAQFNALLANDLWRRNAENANQMAKQLADQLATITGIEIIHPVTANAIFIKMAKTHIEQLQQLFHFYTWDESASVARLMTSFNTSAEEVSQFVKAAQQIVVG
jgi:threonine aldolase